MNKITLETTPYTATAITINDISDRNWQYLYLRLLNRDDLAEAVRSGQVTIEQSERILKGEMQWPVEHTEQA
jgi:hypothetical protein